VARPGGRVRDRSADVGRLAWQACGPWQAVLTFAIVAGYALGLRLLQSKSETASLLSGLPVDERWESIKTCSGTGGPGHRGDPFGRVSGHTVRGRRCDAVCLGRRRRSRSSTSAGSSGTSSVANVRRTVVPGPAGLVRAARPIGSGHVSGDRLGLQALRDVQALDDVSLEIKPGEVFGFLGANGAGKTTAMRIVLDILRPDSGTISWNGRLNTKSRATPGATCPGAWPVRQNEGPRAAGLLRQAPRRWRLGRRSRTRATGWSASASRVRGQACRGALQGQQQKIQFIAAIPARSAGAAHGRAVHRPRSPSTRRFSRRRSRR